jgi:DNA polymerase III sliding clamp (beta) subunit (PCNA family)
MAKKDTRYYLCGVLFSFKHGEVPRIEVVSTDGAIMSAFSDKLEYFDNPQTSDFEFIIPDSAISLAIKGAGKRTFLTIESLPDGRYALGDSIFSPIDGKFPDYRRVIPKTDKPQSEKPLQFDAELLLKAQKAMQDYWTTKKLFTVEHKDDVAVMHNGTNQALLIVTPIRDNAYSYQGFYAVQPLVLAARN